MLIAPQIDDQDNRNGNGSFPDDPGGAQDERICTNRSANGFLHGFTLANFLQYVEMDEKSWTLKICSHEQSGFLHFREGILLDAQIDGKSGETAALEILSWDQVDITVEGECRVSVPNVGLSLGHLLLEACRLVDESE